MTAMTVADHYLHQADARGLRSGRPMPGNGFFTAIRKGPRAGSSPAGYWVRSVNSAFWAWTYSYLTPME